MKSKIREMLNSWDYDELKELESDIRNGGKKTIEALWDVMRNKFNNDKFCAVCFNQLDERRISLNVGPNKVSFCAFDCMEYFLVHLNVKNRLSRNFDFDKGGEE